MVRARVAGGESAFLGYERSGLGIEEKTLLPSFPKEVFPRGSFLKQVGIRRKKRSAISYAPLDKAENGDDLWRFQIDSSSMNNEPTGHMQQMKPQGLQPGGPPRTRQTLPFHHGQDVIS